MSSHEGCKQPHVSGKCCRTNVPDAFTTLQNDPKFREIVAAYTRKAWADGKYDGVKTGKCRWYDHVCPDGTTVKLQGTWEVVFARLLDTQGIAYEAHRGRISYRDGTGVERSYYPDFYVPASDTYYDVKGAFWDDVQRDKIRYIVQSNPNIKLEVINRDSFKQRFGIDVDSEARRIT